MASASGFLCQFSSMEEADFVEKDPTGRYIRYDDVLGRGAFKTVYKAFDEVDGIEVAWNLASIEDVMQMPGQLERLYSEVHLLKALKHENIIKLFYSWVDEKNKTINMITELFTSGSLRVYRKKHKKVDPKAIKNWARQILKGLNYLHSQNPPVIHRDLKCDNIFVNGNTGEVKIGDLGLATVLQQPTARSVIGTPEFMAPELYEEEYNELVDIYSFGMCMLEMVTCEYPYNECRNQAQIYKKVTSNIKPQSLAKVDDPQVKQFIEKCLLPASSRPTALELSNDPFLARDVGKDSSLLASSSTASKPVRPPPPQLEHLPMDVDHNENKSFSSNEDLPWCQAIELQRFAENKEFRLRGERSDDVTASMLLRIADASGKCRIVHFAFFLDSDTATAIAEEMVEELHLTSQEVIVIADMIDDLIIQLNSDQTSSDPPHITREDHKAANQQTMNSKDEEATGQSMKSDISADYYPPFSSHDGSAAMEASREAESMSSFLDSCSMMSTIYNLSISDNDYPEDLRTELNLIESQFNQSFQDLMKLKEDAIVNAKRKWILKKQKAVIIS
ncbi:Serine/threonine-protein kinase WNK8 [Cardamine amara subsp. amara]|uniref:non-specific serine/threonine protein kinase n=1 Tax=Cardamine amara subsp. amara TaxID=228776 RepID=A0ABD1BZU5_CARAN